jgi:hypothetical protein
MKGRKTGGRKPGTPNKSKEEVRFLIDRVAKKHGGMATVVARLFELVEGVEVEKTDKKGETAIYSQPPDAFAAKILMEYRFGKPASTLVIDPQSSFTLNVRYVGKTNGNGNGNGHHPPGADAPTD